MKFKLKSIVAAGMLAMACSAQAAILIPGASDDGELFVSIFRDTASPESMLIDTDVSLLGLQGMDGPQITSWISSAAQTSAIQAFLATAPLNSFRFNAGGVTNQLDMFNFNHHGGFFMTSNTATLNNGPGSSSGMDTFMQNTATFLTGVNQSNANTHVITGLNAGENGYHNAPFGIWGMNGPGTIQNTESLVGTPISLVNYYNASAGLFEYDLGLLVLGSMNINTSTGVASYNLATAPSAVPLPPAFWLLGSGLAGLVGVARRRKA